MSIRVMVKRVAITLPPILAAVTLLLAYYWYDRLPWLETSLRVHSERGGANCGHLTNSGYEAHPDSTAVIHCVESAHQQHRPFVVKLSVYGVDDYYSSAIVGDSKGGAIEIFYWSGMVIRANKLLRRRCDVSGQFLMLNGDKGDIPQPHCHPWPPGALEQDHIFW
ncbi:MAG TPA: hypothetical protein VH350_15390 [Candidatus Sulfotelmatobacter sp.]|nr:hypothetical protein [Candidatus Sulfotelmatobacter sp.]